MDEMTLRRAQKGDPQAFERLMEPYEQMVWRVCWHYIHHMEDARDCAQEAMFKAWRSMADFRGGCSLESWLYRICTSVCLDFLRGQKRRQAESADALREEGIDLPDDAPQPDEEVQHRQEKEELRQAVDSLPEDMRTALILFAMEKKKYEDIAQITGTAVGTVKSRINRARQKLAEILKSREQNGRHAVRQSEGRKQK